MEYWTLPYSNNLGDLGDTTIKNVTATTQQGTGNMSGVSQIIVWRTLVVLATNLFLMVISRPTGRAFEQLMTFRVLLFLASHFSTKVTFEQKTLQLAILAVIFLGQRTF